MFYVDFSVKWDGYGFLYPVGDVSAGLANYFFLMSFRKGGKAAVVTALVATCPLFKIFVH